MHRQNRRLRPSGALVTLLLLAPAGVLAQETQPATSAPSGLGTAFVLSTIRWQDAGAHVGREVYLVGKVVRTGRSRTGHVFLNFDQDYRRTATVFISSQEVKKFAEPPDALYRDKMIKVRGFLTDRDGQPNLSLASPDRISILPDDTPLPPPATRPAGPATRPASDTITVGSYNVLNLFDAVDDPYTGDESTGQKPRQEIEALARSIRKLDADVLALTEVENRGVLQQFMDLHLADMGYEVVAFEGNDLRGIDTAVLSRLPVGPVTSYRHMRFTSTDGRPIRFQRDLLEVRLEPAGGAPFDLFVVHFKSKSGESSDGLEIRLSEARVARSIMDEKLKADPQAAFLIAGDFNDTLDSQPLQATLGSGSTMLISFVDDLPEDHRVTYNQPPYRSMIDFILASPAMAKRYVPKSYNVPEDGSPETTGSDHNPVIARFSIRQTP